MMSLWNRLVSPGAVRRQPDLRGKTLEAIAAERGSDALNVMIDISLEEDRGTLLSADMGHNDDKLVGDLLNHPNVMIGASDGGAHICPSLRTVIPAICSVISSRYRLSGLKPH